jgi:beta-mannosidase
VLEQEAVSIIKRLRTHPCLTFWCGGNELFNSWSGLTLQSHPLRLLDKLCFEHDRFTPFQMTSPMHGVSHGSYVKVVFPDAERRAGDYSHGEEFICAVKRSKTTGYTEFGCNGASPADYIREYIMDEKDYLDCNAENGVWMAHHAFKAWNESCWLGIPEIHHFFGGYESVDDLVEKSIYLQDMCYQSMFEEMRRQAPLCAMAINWDFNEPWPCAAGNSLINWPAKPKSCLQNVKAALRPTLLSLNIPRNRWISGEVMEGEIWVLNDSDTAAEPMEVEVTLVMDDVRMPIAKLATDAVEARKNGKFGTFRLAITSGIPERFSLELTCAAHPEANSRYALVHRLDLSLNEGKTSAATGGNDDFSDFLK